MGRKGDARNGIFVKDKLLGSPRTMQEEQPSTEQMLLDIERLRQYVRDLKREKADLAILLETTTIHSDIVVETLHATSVQLIESNKQLQAELVECQGAEAALKATIGELQSRLTMVTRDKADLEILLETTTEHGDIIEELLHDQSIRDPLTGLFNRRYMERALEREIRRARRFSQPLGIVMSDIDHFQRFNNTYGHEAGDVVLRKMGLFLQTNIRSSDIACRYGGEELMMILPQSSLDDTFARAEHLRQAVKQLYLEIHYQALGAITISIGVACFPEHGQTGAEVIQAADAALYRAKAKGRDRVVRAESCQFEI